MKDRIPVRAEEPASDFGPSRRSALTRLARIAKACTAIVVFGLSAERAYASGNLGRWDGSNPGTVDFDGDGGRNRR